MSKTIYQTVNYIKIYPINYLANEELTDIDLNNLLDNSKLGLTYSLIVNMFKFANSKMTDEQIIDYIKSDKNWMNSIKLTKSKYNKFENMLIQVYKNIYQYKEATAISLAQWFMIKYGFKIKY